MGDYVIVYIANAAMQSASTKLNNTHKYLCSLTSVYIDDAMTGTHANIMLIVC